MNTFSSKSTRPTGMVSILVVMILMIVITLIVLGFAQVSRREQRQSLDRQLSTQAFFAAESGINDARQAIQNAPVGAALAKNVCGPEGIYNVSNVIDDNNDADTTNDVSYPCLLVNTRVRNINLAVGGYGKSVTIPLEPVGAMNQLRINWRTPTPVIQAQVAGNCQPNRSPNFYPSGNASWTCPFGVLRMDIVPTAGALNRGTLAANQKTIFFYPTQAGGPAPTLAWATANGAVAAMRCSAAGGCNINIGGIAGNHMLRLTSIYQEGAADLTAYAGAAQLELNNAQIQIDATGKAQDVLRRIQVRLPVAPSGPTPDFAILSASSICKRIRVNSSTFQIPGDIEDQDRRNPMCRPTTVGNPLGDAEIDGICALLGSCVEVIRNPADPPRWGITPVNQSNNNPADVLGCTWRMGDINNGNTETVFTDTNCQYRDRFAFEYQDHAAYPTCTAYRAANPRKTPRVVTLEIRLRTGTIYDTKEFWPPVNC